AHRSHDWLRGFWSDYAIILGASFVIALLVTRAGAVACLIAMPPLAWQVRRWLRAIRTIDRPLPRFGVLLLVACALLPTFPVSLSALVLPAKAQVAKSPTGLLNASECRIEDSAPILNALPAGEIYAPLDIAPKLLVVSHHSVVATAHHRGEEGLRVVIATALGSSKAAGETLRRRGSSFVALCPGLYELLYYAGAAPDGFAADLARGRAPDWLEPIETAPGTSFKLWRVVAE
ncbi:MAG: hypothetical protein AAFY47_10115, partial [Pseudomonadota bacterium]